MSFKLFGKSKYELLQAINGHRYYIWNFIKERNWRWFWCRKKYIGPTYVWYDGPHYGFGFWWFAVSLDYHNEDEAREVRSRLIFLLGKLLNKIDWF